MIKNKLIAARKAKSMTQKNIADLLFMSQSQYQRRECGEICITDNEWVRIAKFLGKEIQDIKEEDNITTVYNHDNYSEKYAAGDNYFYNIHEFIIKHQQEYIELLKEEIKRMKEKISSITSLPV